ncbi:MAG: acyltransferase family protein [Rhodococcus sp. (in: high G+C Gram-positive bacteria)]
MDSLRALLMLLGVPFHASFVYSGWPWYSNPSTDPSIEWFAAFTHTFRMPTFFVIAGVFAARGLVRYSSSEWWRNRVVRLGLPFLSCVLLLGPLQLLAAAVAAPNDGDVMNRWVESMTVPSNWIFQLWFLPVLLCYCVVLLLCVETRAGRIVTSTFGLWINHGFTGPVRGATALILVGCFTVIAWAGTVSFDPSALTFGIVPARLVVVYFPSFVLGVFIGSHPARYRQFARATPVVVVSAIVTSFVLAALAPVPSLIAEIAEHFLIPVVGILVAATLFTTARKFLEFSSAAVQRLADMSMTIYLFHNVFLLWGAVLLLGVDAPPVVEYFVLICAALAGSALCYLLFSRIPLLALVFNGKRIRSRHSATTVRDGQGHRDMW